MRTLGIETSTRRGSLALLADGAILASAEHEAPNAHSEQLLPLLERLLASSGWARSSLDRIAVGTGPGSFVGLRVGIALAEGLALGLGRPVAGVCSLAAMARAVPAEHRGARAAVLDARQGELFVYVCSEHGATLLEPQAIARADVKATLAAAGGVSIVVGEVAPELELEAGPMILKGADLDLPHARGVALVASVDALVANGPVLPLYVRGPGATRPNLPPSPFGAAGGPAA